jgi:hypothetical protein
MASILIWGEAPTRHGIYGIQTSLHRFDEIRAGRGVAEEKHAIRKSIHKQLAKLWQAVPDLKMRSEAHSILSAPPTRGTPGQVGFTVTTAAATHRESLWKTLGDNFDRCGYKFVPLVSKQLNLTCGLDVLLLQRDGASPFAERWMVRILIIDSRLSSTRSRFRRTVRKFLSGIKKRTKNHISSVLWRTIAWSRM